MVDINYSVLPQRLKRVVKTYDYCIDSIVPNKTGGFDLVLKNGYQTRSGETKTCIADPNTPEIASIETLIYFLKNVVKPSASKLQTALFGFTCPCGTYIPKGTNYVNLEGFKVCINCGLAGE